MSRQNSLGVPLPPNPVKESFGLSEELTKWKEKHQTIQLSDGKIDVSIYASGTPVVKIINTDFRFAETLWTVTYWAHEYNIPGAWKESIKIDGRRYRLGGLYRYAGFDLKEREINYDKHGETKCTPEEF